VPGRAGPAEPEPAGRSRQLPVARPGEVRRPGRTHGPRSAPGWAQGPGRTPGLAPCRRASWPPAPCQRDRWHHDHRRRDRSYQDRRHQDRWHQDRSHLGCWYRAVGRPARDHAWHQAGAPRGGPGPGPVRGHGGHRRPDQCADRCRNAIAGRPGRVPDPTMAVGRTVSRTTRRATRAANRRPGLAGIRAVGPFLAPGAWPASRLSRARSRIAVVDTARIPPARRGQARPPADQRRDRSAVPYVGRYADRSAPPSAGRHADRSAAPFGDLCAARSADQNPGHAPATGDQPTGRSPARTADR
jgi:hypothetical protein